MRHVPLQMACLALLLALSAAAARAAEDSDDADAAAMQAAAREHLSKAKLTMEEAIAIALKKHAGGHAIEAAFEVDGDDYDFIVEVASGNKLFDVEIDAVSGKIESNEPVTDAEPGDQAEMKAVVKSKVPLTKAIAAALEAVGQKGARAFDAGPHVVENKLIFEVGVLAGKDIFDVRIDGATGKVLAQKKIE